MAVDTANHLGGKTCAHCGAWESKPAGVQQQSKGECRKNSPSIAGWPKTMPNDWCRAWEPDERPESRPSSFDCPDISAPIGFDYRYVRDYPASAEQWISAARGAADIPPDLQPLLADPLAGHFTRDLPAFVVEGICGDGLFCWAAQFPGHNNGDHSDNGYRSILTYLDDDEMRAESAAARQALPSEHPWRHVDVTAKPVRRRRKV